MKFKLLLLLFVIALFSSCVTVPRNKAAGYEDKITGSITVYISTISTSKNIVKWSNNLEKNLIAKFEEQGIQANVIQMDGYTSEETNAEIKDNYILYVQQTEEHIEKGLPAGRFIITLFDRKINKNVWKAQMWAVNMQNYNTNPKNFSTDIIKTLQEDNLL